MIKTKAMQKIRQKKKRKNNDEKRKKKANYKYNKRVQSCAVWT